MDARGKFGEHERSVRVARGAAESNSSFSSFKVYSNFLYRPIKQIMKVSGLQEDIPLV